MEERREGRGHRAVVRGEGRPGDLDRGRFGGEGPRGPGGRGGHRSHGGPRVGRGDVRAATLLLLDEQPLHGYQIIVEIGERSGGMWRPSPGSVYPALQLLEDEGLVHVQEEDGPPPRRRVYHLTEAGRAHVKEHRVELAAARDAVTEDVDQGAVALHDLFHQVGTAMKQVLHAGTPAQVVAAQGVLTTTRRQLYRILAEDDDTLVGAGKDSAGAR